MRPEDQLILLLVLLLARGELPPHVQRQAIAVLSTQLNWDLILKRAMAQGVYPLLYRNLQRLRFPGVATQVCTELEALYKVNAFRNAYLAEELERVLKLLGGAGIATIPLKGVTLAESLYGDLTLRVSADIDILVPRQAVAQAFEILLATGFEAYEHKLAVADIDLLLDSNIEYSFVSRRLGFTCLHELHWDVAWRWQRDGMVTDDLWAEAHRKAYWGAKGYALSSEWELLFMAVHAARHQWLGLKWLVDVHELCFSSRIDWEKLSEKAQRLGLSKC